jgi:hypothetical protein
MGKIKKRNIVLSVILSFITLGIYYVYWVVSTKREMNTMGGKIPTSWLIIVPIANIYFFYKYAESFSTLIKKDNNTILWFLLMVVIGPVAMVIIQMELNEYADNATPSNTTSMPIN